MRINLVFNIEGTDELQKVTEALTHVASLNEKVQLENTLERLGKYIKDLREERDKLEAEVKSLNHTVHPDVKISLTEDCKECADTAPIITRG